MCVYLKMSGLKILSEFPLFAEVSMKPYFYNLAPIDNNNQDAPKIDGLVSTASMRPTIKNICFPLPADNKNTSRKKNFFLTNCQLQLFFLIIRLINLKKIFLSQSCSNSIKA